MKCKIKIIKILFELFLSVFIIMVFTSVTVGQYMHDTRIDSVVNLTSQQQVTKFMRELTGDTITNIGGVPRLIFSRLYSSPANNWAAQYIFEKFQSYGLNAYYNVIDSSRKNVIAVKQGTKYPNQKYIICAHYDNILNTGPGPLDTIYGANDNASGVCAVLETARILANMNFEYTLVFAAWDEEERGLLGSQAFADSAFTHGDSILSVINLDMIAYDNNNKIRLYTNSVSMQHAELFVSVCNRYIPDITPVISVVTSLPTDITPFYQKGYQGISPNIYSSDPYYHTINDKISNMNMLYCTKFIKAVIGCMATYGINKRAVFYHNPFVSSYDTSAKIATVVIKFPVQIPVFINSPRLYLKINNNPYTYINSFYRNIDTFKYLIPAQPQGTGISYYFAAQDSTGSYLCTYPSGGSGVNPPGTVPPPKSFGYNIYLDFNQCSNTTPKPINDLQYTNDTLQISQNNKSVSKIKVNLTLYHPNDGDVFIQLKGPNGTLNLSQGNGSGGANYINTTFDDSALISITQGSPPFTGSYKPQNALSYFSNQPASGNWILRVFDSRLGNTGTLENWCILLQLKSQVSVIEQVSPLKYELMQNYPNPFNPVTNIKFQIPGSDFVSLKIYDILGKEITVLVNENLKEGEYQAIFNGNGLPSGAYFYKLTAGDFTDVKRMVLIK